MYVTLDNADALGSLAEQLGEINSSQLVTLTMQMPQQVSSQLNLPGGQVLLHQQEGAPDAPLGDQVSVAFVDPEKEDPVIEKVAPVLPTEVCNTSSCTINVVV